MTKKKKLIIASVVLIAVVGIIVTLSLTVFSLRHVELDFMTSTDKLVVTEEEVVQKGDFSFNKSVFFHSKKQYIENLEKEIPYMEVVNIETVFPNTFVVHCAERQEVYAILQDDQYLICDEDLKVLRKEKDFVSNQQNAMLIEGVDILNESVEEGDFLKVENYYDIFSAFIENNRLLHEQQSFVESIKFSKQHDSNIKKDLPVATVKTFNGQQYKIVNTEKVLNRKVKKLIEVYSQIYSLIGTEIDWGEQTPIEGVTTWGKELLDNAVIEINNFYLDENNIYFNIWPSTESMSIV